MRALDSVDIIVPAVAGLAITVLCCRRLGRRVRDGFFRASICGRWSHCLVELDVEVVIMGSAAMVAIGVVRFIVAAALPLWALLRSCG